jgi:hypothetical protein
MPRRSISSTTSYKQVLRPRLRRCLENSSSGNNRSKNKGNEAISNCGNFDFKTGTLKSSLKGGHVGKRGTSTPSIIQVDTAGNFVPKKKRYCSLPVILAQKLRAKGCNKFSLLISREAVQTALHHPSENLSFTAKHKVATLAVDSMFNELESKAQVNFGTLTAYVDSVHVLQSLNLAQEVMNQSLRY